MAAKHYKDAIPSSAGRVYMINGVSSTIEDATEYEQEGTPFGAGDVCAVCVLECDHAKEGTVHQLTTENVLSENIKFIANGDFAAGDTFAFNGVTMDARTMDNGALPDGCFKTGVVVTAFVKNGGLYFPVKKDGSIPAPTVNDAGKFLRVNASGAYTLETVPNAEEATF